MEEDGWLHTITMKEVQIALGFKTLEVWHNSLRLNSSRVEDELQSRYQEVNLGRKLWRHVAMGQNSDKLGKEMIVKVFVTYSTTVMAHYGDNVMVVK